MIPHKIMQAMLVESDRHVRAVGDFIARWPEHRADLAYGLLGQAIGVCDSFGLDVEGFVANLRRSVPKPAVIVPPTSRQS